MKAQNFFGINEKFDITINEVLHKKAVFSLWDKGLQQYLYIFPLKTKKEVEVLIGKSIELNGEKVEQQVTLDSWKGIGGYEVEPFIDCFKISWWQKDPETRIPKIHSKEVSRAEVTALWKVIQQQPKHEKIKTSKIAEGFVNALGIKQFHTKTGHFSFRYFSGFRKYYLHFNSALKVLELYYYAIIYHKSGQVERIKEDIDLQTKMTYNDTQRFVIKKTTKTIP